MIGTLPGNMPVSTRKKSKTPAPARKRRIRSGHNPFEGHALHARFKIPVWERRLRNSVSAHFLPVPPSAELNSKPRGQIPNSWIPLRQRNCHYVHVGETDTFPGE